MKCDSDRGSPEWRQRHAGGLATRATGAWPRVAREPRGRGPLQSLLFLLLLLLLLLLCLLLY